MADMDWELGGGTGAPACAQDGRDSGRLGPGSSHTHTLEREIHGRRRGNNINVDLLCSPFCC